MNSFNHFVYFIFIWLFLAACNDSSETTPEVPADVINSSLAIFDGDVIEKSEDIEEGVEYWEVKIRNSDGSVVEFYWTKNNMELLKIEGTQGPYDYALNPGLGLINFTTASTQAISAVKNNNILQWELEQNDDFIGKWVYDFDFDTGGDVTEVYIDASNGDVLEID
jgi:hypothetical protein